MISSTICFNISWCMNVTIPSSSIRIFCSCLIVTVQSTRINFIVATQSIVKSYQLLIQYSFTGYFQSDQSIIFLSNFYRKTICNMFAHFCRTFKYFQILLTTDAVAFIMGWNPFWRSIINPIPTRLCHVICILSRW